MDVVDFQEKIPHMVRHGRCGLCKKKYINVIPANHNSQNGLECPDCKSQTVIFELNNPDPDLPPLRCI